MTMEERNYLFEEKTHLINNTMHRHRALIRACRMEDADVYQQLSLRLINALNKYAPAKCPNIDAYLMLQLRYELLEMKAGSKLTSVTGSPKKGFSLISLDAREMAGYPVEDFVHAEPSHLLWLENEINTLPATQKSAISRILSGRRIFSNNKALRAARFRIKERLAFSARLQCA